MSQEYASSHGSGKPLCMATYNHFFSTCRVPGENKDHLMIYKKDHFIIACKNQFFAINLTQNERKCTSTLIEVVKTVMSLAKETNSPPVGILTSDNRRTWFASRQKLIQLSK